MSYTWDHIDDYYFTVINNIELNIRAYDNNSIHLWAYCHDNNLEMIDDTFQSLQEIHLVLNKNLKYKITLPKLEDLLQIQEQGA